MKEAPVDFDTGALVRALRSYWELDVRELTYLAVGFGAHHWRATSASGERYFLALHEPEADSQGFQRLEQALGGAGWLATSAELDFVVGQLPDITGKS
jgi:hypothetical protein